MKTSIRRVLAAASIFVLSAGVTASCERKSKVEEAADEVGDSIEQAADEVGDAIDEATE